MLVALIEFPSPEAAQAFAMSTERARAYATGGGPIAVTTTTDEFLESDAPDHRDAAA